MSKTYFAALLEREVGYELIKTVIYDLETHDELGEAYLFSGNKNDGTFTFGCKAQERYLNVCLEGAKSLGPEFYENFLKTTYIEGKPLSEILQVEDLI